MNLKTEHKQLFKVISKGPITTKRTLKGRMQKRQELKLRCLQANINEGNHSVLFFDASTNHSNACEEGDTIELTFSMFAGVSTTGITHTNIVPHKILIT